MLNCIDMDGQGKGYDIPLIQAVQNAVTIPVIASSGAGAAQHFVEVFQKTSVNAALAAGIFHRHEVGIDEVKQALRSEGIPFRK
jgi:glutamine amidotransferase/cyclase